MLSAITRFVFIVCLAFIAAYITLANWGVNFAITAGMTVLAIPLAYSYVNLARLRKYAIANAVENMPLPSGFWEEVFFRLQRLVRNLKLEIQSIEKQHNRFIEAFQASPNGIVMLDDQDQIEWCNAIAERFFGLEFKRDVLQRINFLIRRPEFIQYLNKRIFEEPLGKGIFSTALAMAYFLKKADAMRRDFVANVSHEMRTPITVLMGFLETIQSLDLDKAQQTQYIELMMSQVQRMKSLVEDLLTLANLEANTLPAPMQAVQVPTIMALLKNDAQALSQGKHAFNFEVLTSASILGEERELLSAFSNLVSNAVRYTPDVGMVSVKWSLNADGQGEFSVTDTGPGIASEHLSRLTERFYRVDRSRSRDTGGTGLGLAIVKHIANRHHAQLQIESSPGKGSTFRLRFPKERISL